MFLSETILLAFGLAMDAFAVSVSCGITDPYAKKTNSLRAGTAFGFFQAMMLLIGFALGFSLKAFIEPIDHWVAFVLLGFIGGKMIKESLEPESEPVSLQSFKTLIILSFATSIDAMAAGISLAALGTSIILPAIATGVITFLASVCGVWIGAAFRTSKLGSTMDFLGGIILIAIGIKILLEHMFFV